MSSVYPFPTVERSRPDRGAYAARIIYARGDTFANAGIRYIVNTGHFVSNAGGRTFAQELAAGFFVVDPNPPSSATGTTLPALSAAQANHYYRINAAGNAVGTTPTIPVKITPWAASTAVEAGETRHINGSLYTSNSARTTGATFNAAEAGNWTAIAGRYRGNFLTGAMYHIGDLIADPTNNNLYRCTTAYVGGANRAANAGNWATASATLIYRGDWAATTAYTVGQLVHDGATLYRCTVAHTSGATRALNAGNWSRVSNTISPWAASDRVQQNEIRVQSARLWSANTTRTTTATFNAAEAGNFTELAPTLIAIRGGLYDAELFRASNSAANNVQISVRGMPFVNRATGQVLVASPGTVTTLNHPVANWASTAIGVWRDIYAFCDVLGGNIELRDEPSPTGTYVSSHVLTPATVVAGKPFAAFCGSWLWTTAGTQLLDMIYHGTKAVTAQVTFYTGANFLTDFADSTHVQRSVASGVPPRARVVRGSVDGNASGAGAVVLLRIGTVTSGVGQSNVLRLNGLATVQWFAAPFTVNLEEQQLTIFRVVSGALTVPQITFSTSGFEV